MEVSASKSVHNIAKVDKNFLALNSGKRLQEGNFMPRFVRQPNAMHPIL